MCACVRVSIYVSTSHTFSGCLPVGGGSGIVTPQQRCAHLCRGPGPPRKEPGPSEEWLAQGRGQDRTRYKVSLEDPAVPGGKEVRRAVSKRRGRPPRAPPPAQAGPRERERLAWDGSPPTERNRNPEPTRTFESEYAKSLMRRGGVPNLRGAARVTNGEGAAHGGELWVTSLDQGPRDNGIRSGM